MVEVSGEVVAVPPFVAHGHDVATSLLLATAAGDGDGGAFVSSPIVPQTEPTVLRLSARPDTSVRAVHDGHWLLLQAASRDDRDEY